MNKFKISKHRKENRYPHSSNELFKISVEAIPSTTIAAIDSDGRPITRVIDMMTYDENNEYFLSVKEKEYYRQLMEQGYVLLSSIKVWRRQNPHSV